MNFMESERLSRRGPHRPSGAAASLRLELPGCRRQGRCTPGATDAREPAFVDHVACPRAGASGLPKSVRRAAGERAMPAPRGLRGSRAAPNNPTRAWQRSSATPKNPKRAARSSPAASKTPARACSSTSAASVAFSRKLSDQLGCWEKPKTGSRRQLGYSKKPESGS